MNKFENLKEGDYFQFQDRLGSNIYVKTNYGFAEIESGRRFHINKDIIEVGFEEAAEILEEDWTDLETWTSELCEEE